MCNGNHVVYDLNEKPNYKIPLKNGATQYNRMECFYLGLCSIFLHKSHTHLDATLVYSI